jgi:hypothetical protein
MNMVLKNFKTELGAINFKEVLKIPTADRIGGLVMAGGYQRICVMLSAGIQVAMESLNLSRPLTADQTIDLADVIIDTATEDNLSIEDVVLFLQKIVRGETGTLYSSMDVAKFMNSFESYRQERHENIVRYREEKHAQFKVMGREARVVHTGDGPEVDDKTFFELLKTVNDERYGEHHESNSDRSGSVHDQVMEGK